MDYFFLDTEDSEGGEIKTNMMISPPTLVLFFEDYKTNEQDMKIEISLDIRPYVFKCDRAVHTSKDYYLRNLVTYSEEKGYTTFVLYDDECYELDNKGQKQKLEDKVSDMIGKKVSGVVMAAYSK